MKENEKIEYIYNFCKKIEAVCLKMKEINDMNTPDENGFYTEICKSCGKTFKIHPLQCSVDRCSECLKVKETMGII